MAETEIIELPDGRLRKQEKNTGKIIWTQAANKRQLRRLEKAKEVKINNSDYFKLFDKDNNPVWVHKNMIVQMQDPDGNLVNVVAGLDPGKLPRKIWHYSPDMAKLICSKISQGKTLKAICNEKGMPTRDVVYMWVGQYEEFRDAMKMAKALRAEVFADQLVETAEEVDDNAKFAIEKAKLKVKAYEWMARKDNPDVYDKKGEQKQQGPARIIINTGVNGNANNVSIDGKEQ